MPEYLPYPVIDGHNDTLLRLYRSPERDFFVESDQGHIDFPRAKRGGMAGGFFAIFASAPDQGKTMRDNLRIYENSYEVLPIPAIDPAQAQKLTIGVMARLFQLERESGGQIKVVRSLVELETCLRMGVLAVILHIEGAEAIDADLEALEVFYQAGLRSLGPVWSRPNIFGEGVPFKFPHSPDTGPGLTERGRALVKACNQLGIMIDLSHLNEQGFFDVANLSDAPLVVTHSAVHAICASTRNLMDRQLDAIKASQGVVGLNFEASNLRPDAWDDSDAPISLMVEHIDYLVKKLGIDGVAFGSDFDGISSTVREIKDVADLPNLIAALQAHGYDDAALRKLTYENWLRVLGQTWHS
jgi:membrane dipeptidase